MSIEERVKKVVAEQLDVSGDIDNNASFIDDLGADSLDTVELVMSLEEEFDCEIPDDQAENITTVQVPGTFELTVAAKILLQNKKYDAIICIGCVIKGETSHNEYINNSVAMGLTNLGLAFSVPGLYYLCQSRNQIKPR